MSGSAVRCSSAPWRRLLCRHAPPGAAVDAPPCSDARRQSLEDLGDTQPSVGQQPIRTPEECCEFGLAKGSVLWRVQPWPGHIVSHRVVAGNLCWERKDRCVAFTFVHARTPSAGGTSDTRSPNGHPGQCWLKGCAFPFPRTAFNGKPWRLSGEGGTLEGRLCDYHCRHRRVLNGAARDVDSNCCTSGNLVVDL